MAGLSSLVTATSVGSEVITASKNVCSETSTLMNNIYGAARGHAALTAPAKGLGKRYNPIFLKTQSLVQVIGKYAESLIESDYLALVEALERGDAQSVVDNIGHVVENIGL